MAPAVSATRLLVLGVVRMSGSAHGYQVRRTLLSWSADRWANVHPGSIYHALKQLAKEGLLAADQPEAGGGPARVCYRLTEDGEAEFGMLLARALTDADATGHLISAAVTFLTALPRPRALGLLRHLLTRLEGGLQETESAWRHTEEWGKPEHTEELYRLWGAHARATRDWVAALIERLEAGRYVMADDPGAAFGKPGAEPA